MSPMDPLLRLGVLREDTDTVVVQLAGELDIATGPLVRARLGDLLDHLPEPPLARLVFDLHDLEFTDVAGLAVLLRVQREVAAHGGVVLLRRPSALVRRVLTLLDLQRRLVVEPEPPAAAG